MLLLVVTTWVWLSKDPVDRDNGQVINHKPYMRLDKPPASWVVAMVVVGSMDETAVLCEGSIHHQRSPTQVRSEGGYTCHTFAAKWSTKASCWFRYSSYVRIRGELQDAGRRTNTMVHLMQDRRIPDQQTWWGLRADGSASELWQNGWSGLTPLLHLRLLKIANRRTENKV